MWRSPFAGLKKKKPCCLFIMFLFYRLLVCFSLSFCQLANSGPFSDTMNGINSIFALYWTISASNAFLFQMGKRIAISCSCWTLPAMQHHSGFLISSPLLILPFFTAVEYEYDISVEHVYYNSRIPFCNVNTTSETVAVCFWMLKGFQAQTLNCEFSKPNM